MITGAPLPNETQCTTQGCEYLIGSYEPPHEHSFTVPIEFRHGYSVEYSHTAAESALEGTGWPPANETKITKLRCSGCKEVDEL